MLLSYYEDEERGKQLDALDAKDLLAFGFVSSAARRALFHVNVANKGGAKSVLQQIRYVRLTIWQAFHP